MLKGLEATEVNFNKLLTGVETFRLDSEYHRKEYLEIEDYVSSHSGLFSKFSDYDVPIDCSAFYPGIEQLYGTGDIPIIRVQNVKGAIDYENCATLPSLMDPKYATLKTVSEGDIVITKGGTIGLAGYVTKTAYASRDLIIVKSSSLPEDTRIFLYLYLSTDFAYKQLIRSSSQCAQPHLTITLVKNFDLLKPINALEKRCSDLYKESQSKLDVSKSLYNKAEDILLKYLGVPSNINESNIFNVKTLSESFLNSGRLDPEYYQTKYDGLFSLLGKFKTKTLSSIADIKKSIEPGSDEYTETGIPFIRVADLSKYGLSRPSTFLDKDAYRSVIRPQKDTILLSKDGSVGGHLQTSVA